MAPNSGEAKAKLREFGYAFNEAGELRKIDSTGKPGDEPFVFEISKNHAENQAHYEKLAEQIPEIIYELLEQNGFNRIYLPLSANKDLSTFVFTKPEKLHRSKKLLILIHGSGYVRAGQWARSLIINNSLDHGTVLPYVREAEALGYDILITNTNDNSRVVGGKRKAIPGLESATSHANYVWKHIVVPSDPESVAIVAHSYGGAVTLELANQFTKFFKEKVFAVAFTDSAHGNSVPKAARDIIAAITCNWASSEKPLDAPLLTSQSELLCVSAGHPKHEWSSYAAFPSVFKYLERKYESFDAAKNQTKKSET